MMCFLFFFFFRWESRGSDFIASSKMKCAPPFSIQLMKFLTYMNCTARVSTLSGERASERQQQPRNIFNGFGIVREDRISSISKLDDRLLFHFHNSIAMRWRGMLYRVVSWCGVARHHRSKSKYAILIHLQSVSIFFSMRRRIFPIFCCCSLLLLLGCLPCILLNAFIGQYACDECGHLQ